LDKTYEFEILVGFSTDTHDLLGLVTLAKPADKNSASGEPLRGPEFLSAGEANITQSFVGTFIQKYPNYSSKTVGGKQLFELSKEDNLPDQMPEHEVTIYELSLINTKTIEKEVLEKEIERRVNLAKGDFRQEEIIKKWREEFEKIDQKEFEILKFTCKCSSGTYIRQLVADMGEKIGVPLVTYSIRRTQVGEYSL
jgi:tRNA pseudouridine55 synthase